MTTDLKHQKPPAYSEQDLAEFEKLIKNKLIIEEYRRTNAISDLADFNDSHTDEDDEFNGERSGIQDRIAVATQNIKECESALNRIDANTYGVCKATGKLIDKRRLLLRPMVMLSLSADNKS